MFAPFTLNGEESLEDPDDQKDLETFTLPQLKLEDLSKAKLPKEAQGRGLKIVAFKTTKDKVKKDQRPVMKEGIIPSHPSTVLFNGKSGSGKSVLLVNLLARPEFYGNDKKGDHYFDEIYLFSPTAGEMDDLPKHLEAHSGLKKKNIHNKFDEDLLIGILKKQAAIIKSKGDISKAPKVLLLLDDVAADQKFLKSKVLLRLAIASRHYNISCWIATQSFNLIPRAIRLQSNDLFVFLPGGSEAEVLYKEFSPAGMNRKEFMGMLMFSTGEPYSFMHIRMRQPPRTRFVRNLDELMELTSFN